MRHRKSGRKLHRTSSHRKAFRANLTCALIQHGRITTTLDKAKAVQPFAERMITLGKHGTLHARRRAVALLRDKASTHQLFERVGPAMRERSGGYTRILKLSDRRLGDGSFKVLFELVDGKPPSEDDEAAGSS